ncbi:MAG: ABC-2 family transporter protein [Myxococcales bacterium]|nr:ABC-2 family transporter protein [Myxococcales bacterium]
MLELRRTIGALVALLRVSVATAMQYRSNFVFGLATALLVDAMRVAPLLLVYGHREQVAGWDLPHALLVVAFFFLLFGVQAAVLEPNLGEAVQAIRSGALDLILMKPVDAQLLVSLRKVDAASLFPVVSAAVVGAVALAMSEVPGPLDVVLAAALFVSGVVSLYCLWLLAICVSFWFVRVDNLRFLLWSATDAGRWPIDVFRGPVRWILTAIVPVALITSFPAQALRGAWDVELLGTSAAVSAAFLLGSRWAWRRSLAAYASASS